MGSARLERVTAALEGDRVFVGLALVLAAGCGLGQLLAYHGPTEDYWEHLAAARALARAPLDPAHPMLGDATPSHLFTPYHLLWGLLARVSGLHPFWLAPLLAAANLGLFAAGALQVSRRWLRAPERAGLLLLVLVGLWGRPQDWSGFHQLGLLPSMAAYPFWAALGIALAWLGRFAGAPRRRRPLHALAVTLVFLIHPITGSFLALALTLIGASRAARARERMQGGLIAAAGLALSFAWPWFPVYDAVRSDDALAFAAGSRFYAWAPMGSGPALVGLLAIRSAARTRPGRPAVALLAGAAALWILNAFTLRSPVFARYVVFVTLALQILAVIGFDSVSPRWRARYRALLLALLGLGLGVQLAFAARGLGLVRDLQHGAPPGTLLDVAALRDLSALAPALPEGSVVLADPADSARLPGLLGAAVVALPHAGAFVSVAERDRRHADVLRFLDPAASGDERGRITATYGVTHVLMESTVDSPRLVSGHRWRRVGAARGRVLYALMPG